MGTKSLTQFIEDDTIICTLYRQFDGYPSGHGLDLFNFLNGFIVVNGFSSDMENAGKYANGIECLAAQVIAHFKTGIGQFYMVSGGEHDQDYTYQIKVVSIEDNVIHKDGTIGNSNYGPYKIMIKIINYDNIVVLDWSELETFKMFCEEN